MYAPSRTRIFVLFTLAYFLSYFFRSANAVIAGDLSRDLTLTPAQLGLMTSLFYACFALVQLPLGVGLDRYGPRFVTAGLMLATVAGALLFASARSFVPLAAGRALIGLGMAGVLMGALKAFAQWFAPQRLASISGVLVGIGASGGLVAASPLAWLNALVGWRAIFAGGALVTLLVALALALGVRNTPPGTRWPAAVRGDGGFRQVFGDLRFWRVAPLMFFLLGTTLAVQSLWGGPYLFDVLRLDPLAAGNLLLALGTGAVVGYFACGWLAERYGTARSTLVAGLVFLLCLVLFALPGLVLPPALLALVFAALGFCGSFNIVLLALMRAAFPAQLGGRVITAVNLFGFAGAALIQWWMGLIIGSFAPDAQGHYPPQAYATVFGLTALCMALCVVWYAPLAWAEGPALNRQEAKRAKL